jgi:hypothetical protein
MGDAAGEGGGAGGALAELDFFLVPRLRLGTRKRGNEERTREEGEKSSPPTPVARLEETG